MYNNITYSVNIGAIMNNSATITPNSYLTSDNIYTINGHMNSNICSFGQIKKYYNLKFNVGDVLNPLNPNGNPNLVSARLNIPIRYLVVATPELIPGLKIPFIKRINKGGTLSKRVNILNINVKWQYDQAYLNTLVVCPNIGPLEFHRSEVRQHERKR